MPITSLWNDYPLLDDSAKNRVASEILKDAILNFVELGWTKEEIEDEFHAHMGEKGVLKEEGE